jgi:co-chaperonin GroES (HSP10)
MKKMKKKEESTREGLFVSGEKKKKEKRGEKILSPHLEIV